MYIALLNEDLKGFSKFNFLWIFVKSLLWCKSLTTCDCTKFKMTQEADIIWCSCGNRYDENSLAHLAQRATWAIVITLRHLSSSASSVNFSHFRLLLWNHWTDVNQTWQICKAGGPLPGLLNWCRSEIQHGRRCQLCVLIGPNSNIFLSEITKWI